MGSRFDGRPERVGVNAPADRGFQGGSMAAFFRQLIATILALVVVMVGGFFLLVVIIAAASVKKSVVPDHATLYLQIPAAMADYPPTRGRPFGDRPLTVDALCTGLPKHQADR